MTAQPLERASFLEPHYTVAELAKAWHMSPATVRAWFENEPGVIREAFPLRKGKKRGYTTLRIPESVARRVYMRMTRG